MAEPARELYDPEDSEELGSSLRSKEEQPHRPSLSVLDGGQQAGKAEPSSRATDSAGSSPKSPAKEVSGDTDSFKYTNNGKPKRGLFGRAGKFFGGSKKRIAFTAVGSLGVSGVVGAFMLFSVASGPLEFVHIAQILVESHFGALQNAGDERLGKTLYDVMKGGSSASKSVGNTRLNYLERFYKNRIIGQLEDIGVEPKFEGPLQSFKGFTIDTTNPKSPFNGLTNDEAVNAMQEQMGNAKLSVTDIGEGKFFVDGSDIFLSSRAAIRGMVNILGDSKWPIDFRFRTLTKYSLADFHPLHILESGANRLAVWAKNLFQNESDTESTPGEISQNSDGTTTPVPEEANSLSNASGIQGILDSVKTGGASAAIAKATGGLGYLSLIICSFNGLSKDLGLLRYTQVIIPLIRMGMEAITVGHQVMYDQDVDVNELGQLSKQFTSVDSQGNITSVWSNAAPIQAETGGSGGVDMNQGIKDILHNNSTPTWLAWAASGAVNDFCAPIVQLTLAGVNVIIGLATGETFNTVVGLLSGVLQGVMNQKIVSAAASFIAGKAINVAEGGAAWGNDIDYGSALASNETALQSGGTVLSNQQVAQLNAQNQAESAAQFHTESLADRIFNPYDYRSIVGNMIDQINFQGLQSISSWVGNIPSIFGSLLKVPVQLLSAVGLAATPNPSYQYPFTEFGFSEQDLSSSSVQDPEENAVAVGQLLDNNGQNGGTDYIQKALDCFGVSIFNGPQGWDVMPSTEDSSTGQSRTYGVDPYDSSDYDQTNCSDSSDQSWLQIRFWILDTSVMDGYTCYLGDNTSCSDDGFPSTSLVTGQGGVPSGS